MIIDPGDSKNLSGASWNGKCVTAPRDNDFGQRLPHSVSRLPCTGASEVCQNGKNSQVHVLQMFQTGRNKVLPCSQAKKVESELFGFWRWIKEGIASLDGL